MACSLPHTDSEIEALVQRLINEDKGRQDALLELAFRFEDSCAVRDDLRKAYEKCNEISQESRALIDTLLILESYADIKVVERERKDLAFRFNIIGRAGNSTRTLDHPSLKLLECSKWLEHRS
ncbi:hypothetical protein Tco_0830995 [Tanacetum coccineum]